TTPRMDTTPITCRATRRGTNAMNTPWRPAPPPAGEPTEDRMTVTSRLDLHVGQPRRAFGTLQWQLDTERPRDWVAQLVRFGGGVFHSPLGLALRQADGAPVF